MTKRNIAVAALLASIALSGCRNADGTPVSGGRIFLSRPGTQANVVGYTGADATAAHTLDQGGILLDAGGRQKIYVNEPVDVRVQTSSGVDVDSFADPSMDAKVIQVRNAGFTGTDPVSGAQVAGGKAVLDTILTNLATSLGGTDGLVKISANATGRSINAMFSDIEINAKGFGATGGGVADDTAAIQLAINYVAGFGGGVVYIPPGTYLTSSALSVPTGVSIIGASSAVSIIKNTNTATGVFTVPTFATCYFRSLRINHSSSSSGTGILAGGSSIVTVDDLSISLHTNGISAATLVASRSTFTAPGAGFAATAGQITSTGNFYSSSTGSGLIVNGGGGVGSAGGRLVDDIFQGAIGLNITSGAPVSIVSSDGSLATVGLQIAVTAGVVLTSACNWGTVTDSRTAAPVVYSFAGANNMTPLPFQADVIRVAQATGGVVTTINNIATSGFVKEFTLICSNTSAGASNFTFGAAYVLSAAVAPAAGTRVALKLYFDPVSAKSFEVSRAATAN